MSLKWELAHNSRCGLCSYYPIDVGNRYLCPLCGHEVFRSSRPRKQSHGLGHYICFHPMTELAWETFQKIRRQRDYKRKKRLRQENPQPHREEVKLYHLRYPWIREEWDKKFKREHPEYGKIMSRRYYQAHKKELKEKNWFRSIIEEYDPLSLVKRRFAYYQKREKNGFTLLEHNFPKEPDAPVEPYNPVDTIEVAEPMLSNSEQRGGVDRLWKSHPDTYRRRNLKFARLDMQ